MVGHLDSSLSNGRQGDMRHSCMDTNESYHHCNQLTKAQLNRQWNPVAGGHSWKSPVIAMSKGWYLDGRSALFEKMKLWWLCLIELSVNISKICVMIYRWELCYKMVNIILIPQWSENKMPPKMQIDTIAIHLPRIFAACPRLRDYLILENRNKHEPKDTVSANIKTDTQSYLLRAVLNTYEEFPALTGS